VVSADQQRLEVTAMADQIPQEEIEQRKELYAHMGAAMSCAADLEVGLIHALLAVDFLSGYAEIIKKEGFKPSDRPKWERDYDSFFEKHQKLPMGALIKRFEKFATTRPDLMLQLYSALKTRNFLAHRFFREHAASIHNWNGREKMIAELWDAQIAMHKILDAVEEFVKPFRKKLGFDEVAIRRHVDACIQAAEAGDALPEF
jgi:uncharacterized protein (DUF2164 family)